MYYLISDTHFLHDNIIKYTNRPTDHNRIMIKNWIETITEDDSIFHLGDVACSVKGIPEKEKKLKRIFDILPGKKHLIKGNHDTFPDDFYYELGFQTIANTCVVLDYSMLLIHYPLRIQDTDKPHIREFIQDVKTEFENRKLKYVIHGHTHNNMKDEFNSFHYNVSVEKINYTPISLEKVYEELQKRNKN